MVVVGKCRSSFGRRVCYGCSRGFRYGRREVDEVRTTAIVRSMGTSVVVESLCIVTGFEHFTLLWFPAQFTYLGEWPQV